MAIFKCVRLWVWYKADEDIAWQLPCIGRTLSFSSTPQSQLGRSRISISPLKSMMQTLIYLSSYLLLWSLSIQFIHMHCASWDAAWQILREISLFDCWSLWAGYLSVLPTWWTPDRCTLPWMTSSVKSYENSVLGQTMPRSHLQYKFCINKQFPQKYTTGTFFKLLMNWVSKYQPGRNIGSILAFPWLIDEYVLSSAYLRSVCVCVKSQFFWIMGNTSTVWLGVRTDVSLIP